VDGVGDGEFKAQHDAALVKHVGRHDVSGGMILPASVVMMEEEAESGRKTTRISRDFRLGNVR